MDWPGGGGRGGSRAGVRCRETPLHTSAYGKCEMTLLFLEIRGRKAFVESFKLHSSEFVKTIVARFAASSPPSTFDLTTTSTNPHLLLMACSRPTMRPWSCWKGFLRQSRQQSASSRCLSTAPISPPTPRIPPHRLPANTPITPYVRTSFPSLPKNLSKATPIQIQY